MHSVRGLARLDEREAGEDNEKLYRMLNLCTSYIKASIYLYRIFEIRFVTPSCLRLKQIIKRRHATCELLKASGLASQTLRTELFRSCNYAAKRRVT